MKITIFHFLSFLILYSSALSALSFLTGAHENFPLYELVEESGENSESDKEEGEKDLETTIAFINEMVVVSFKMIKKGFVSKTLLYGFLSNEVKTPPPEYAPIIQ